MDQGFSCYVYMFACMCSRVCVRVYVFACMCVMGGVVDRRERKVLQKRLNSSEAVDDFYLPRPR